MARDTVRRYAHAQSFPEHAARVPEPSILDPYLGHLEARLAGGCENASVLWRDLKELGFVGSAKPVRRWLNERRTAPAKSTPHQWRSDQSRTASDPVHGPAALLSPRQLAWLLVRSPEALDASATATLARIAQDPEVGGVLALVQRFAELVRDCGIHRDKAPANPRAVFGTWLED